MKIISSTILAAVAMVPAASAFVTPANTVSTLKGMESIKNMETAIGSTSMLRMSDNKEVSDDHDNLV